ncbi:Zinc finger RING-type [Penicillium lagena]|uniref:Zinc finger RING-type n=1 Tax=Penicillium lagena TaxID=94218 RepID=UPI002541F78F|nr:Zinc finger RING-type [Penicillium lagena]KAJ5620309.1 Zinc finger RING-type [Penicillium lagena]
MSASTATTAASTISSDAPRPGRLRRLSQLRAYTQNHLSSSTRGSHRNSLSSRVSWRSPTSNAGPDSTPLHGETAAGPCPDSDHPALSRYTSAPTSSSRVLDHAGQASSTDSARSTPSIDPATQTPHVMARLRSASAVQSRPPPPRDRTANPEPSSSSPEPSMTQGESAEPTDAVMAEATSPKPKQKATIRFFPYQDSLQNSRPSLPFVPITRTLPSESCVIKVGRYSERDGVPIPNPGEPSDAPVGFKSKVVSRKHCEFMYVNGQWHIKDVGSSSGTFLNHMRLSQPNMVSRLYTIKDGDIVQLGIDFRGGEEMIFRCVRIRIECNRSWQQQPNEFNKNTESLIKNLGKGDTADYSGCRECSICLGSVLRPYQCLFMAACAHVWHYKCISRLLHSPDYPMFQCPNCRAFTDLSAEVDDSNDHDGKDEGEKGSAAVDRDQPRSETQSPADLPNSTGEQGSNSDGAEPPTEAENLPILEEGATPVTEVPDNQSSSSPAPDSSNDDLARSATINIPGWQPTQPLSVPPGRPSQLRSETPIRSETSDDNPMTPRNDSGPLAFDGRAGMP